jgi:hypothetical protein
MASGSGSSRLGVLWIVYGCIQLAVAAWMLIESNSLTLMWGALLNRVPNALAWMSSFHAVFILALAWCVASAFFAFAAGFAGLRGAGSARSLLLVASVLALPEWPLGVALGVYTLVIMLSAAPARPQLAEAGYARPVSRLQPRESH